MSIFVMRGNRDGNEVWFSESALTVTAIAHPMFRRGCPLQGSLGSRTVPDSNDTPFHNYDSGKETDVRKPPGSVLLMIASIRREGAK